MAHFNLARYSALFLVLASCLVSCASPPSSVVKISSPPPEAPVSTPASAINRSFPQLAKASPQQIVNRLSWGVTPADLQRIQSQGVNQYLSGQLRPAPAQLPAAVQAQIAQMRISQTPLLNLMQDLERVRSNADQNAEAKEDAKKDYQQQLQQLALEAGSRRVLRGLYSDRQLEEQMLAFWSNHFNIHLAKHNVRGMLGDFEESALRPHALGRFQDLLRATATHPAMLRYLDNEHNAVNKINENYARELMELHTMGVNSGYTQRDVQELARVLTGVGINLHEDPVFKKAQFEKFYVRRGMFEFNPRRHDFGAKQLLGTNLSAQGLAELDQALSLLCKQRATAQFISTKLALFFVSDTPSAALINAMANSFQRSDGDIPSVLASMFDSAEFADSLGRKFKDPQHYVMASMRLAYDGRTIVNPLPVLHWLNQLGEQFNGRQTPDGYSMLEASWASPAQMVARFDLAKTIANGTPILFKLDGVAQANSKPPELASSAFVKNMALGFSASSQQTLRAAKSPQEWGAFFLAAPEMMRR